MLNAIITSLIQALITGAAITLSMLAVWAWFEWRERREAEVDG